MIGRRTGAERKHHHAIYAELLDRFEALGAQVLAELAWQMSRIGGVTGAMDPDLHCKKRGDIVFVAVKLSAVHADT